MTEFTCKDCDYSADLGDGLFCGARAGQPCLKEVCPDFRHDYAHTRVYNMRYDLESTINSYIREEESCAGYSYRVSIGNKEEWFDRYQDAAKYVKNWLLQIEGKDK